MINTLNVDLNERSYPITIGQDLFSSDVLEKAISGDTVFLVTNDIIEDLYADKILSALKNKTCHKCILNDGEQYKNIESFETIIGLMLENNHNRNTTLVALGGGVVGDITGYAAASFMRGVNFIQIPTSLLAQVDSSVGGKTGINHLLGKNMIGAFHQPKAVFIDINTLKTLPQAQFRAGMAEVIKHALIQDEAYFEFLENNIEKIHAKDPDVLIEMIKRSCEIKANVVAQDEKESGLRAILNFGHTIGHAIETAMDYQMLHGDAVFIGMRYALDLSVAHGELSAAERERAIALFKAFDAPLEMPSHLEVEDIISHMMRDKKFKDGIQFILISKIGHAFISKAITQDNVRAVLGS